MRERRYLAAEELEEYAWGYIWRFLHHFGPDDLFAQLAPASTGDEADRIELAKLRRRMGRLNDGLVTARAELHVVEDEDRPQQEQVAARLMSQLESVQTQIAVIERRVGENAATVEEQAAWLDASSRLDQWLSITDKEEQRDRLSRLGVQFHLEQVDWVDVNMAGAEGLTIYLGTADVGHLIGFPADERPAPGTPGNPIRL